jgi:hypothetical protein
MNKKEKIEQEISKTFEQFENAEKLPPNPYFYTRVQARLEEKQKQQNVFFAILKPALIIALLAVNMSTAIWYLGGSEQQDETNSRQELLEMLASDLKLDDEQNSGFIFE